MSAATKRLDYQGIYVPKQASRLAACVSSIATDILCKMSFSVDAGGMVVLAGEAETTVALVCQRCDAPFAYRIHIHYHFSPVTDEMQIEKLPAAYEPMEIDEFGEVDLLSLIEDELILALPTVPVHDLAQCNVSEQDRVFGELPESEHEKKQNPFAVLAHFGRNERS